MIKTISLLVALMIANVSILQAGAVPTIATLGKGESIEVIVIYEGSVPDYCKYTFTDDKVVIALGDQKIGEIKLTEAEKAKVDRSIELVRHSRHGTGNGSSNYKISYFKKDRERRNLREKYNVLGPPDTTLSELRKRAKK
jgi:hypothetical protein